jgi:hypothetical protein
VQLMYMCIEGHPALITPLAQGAVQTLVVGVQLCHVMQQEALCGEEAMTHGAHQLRAARKVQACGKQMLVQRRLVDKR